MRRRGTVGARKNIRVAPRKAKRGRKRVTIGWKVSGGGPVIKTKKQSTAWSRATARAKKLARRGTKTEVVVKSRNGQIRERNSFGHDPFPTRG